MFKKSPLKSQKILKRKRRIRIIIAVTTVLAFIVLVTLAAIIINLHIFKIDKIAVVGNAALSSQDIQTIAEQNIAGKYLYIFSKANRFFYPKQAIETLLLQQYKRIENVSLDVSNHELTVHINERKPAYVWCSGVPTPSQDKSCYFVDSNGYIFSEAPIFSGNAYVAFYGLVNSGDPIGSTYIPKDSFKGVDTIIEFLNSKNIHPYALLANTTGIYELYLEKAGKIIFKNDQDSSLLVNTLDLVLNNTDILTKKSSDLEYLDLRFGNKLYYKEIGDNQVQSPK